MFRHSEFVSANGLREHFFTGHAAPAENFSAEAETLLRQYEETLVLSGCSPETEILLRFHLSDIANQAPLLRTLLTGRSSFVSMVGQPPAGGSRIALEAWHWNSGKKNFDGRNLLVTLKNYGVLFFHTPDPPLPGSADQTAYEFEALKQKLAAHSASVEANTVRTWLYCRDVDNNYSGLVRARNDFFALNGLTSDTHFIASTGIEGQSENPSRLVTMDSLNCFGLCAGQQHYLCAPAMLSPTALYGVSFERGTRVVFGDRSHCFISGTASIDHAGKVVHLQDVERQAVRMLDNIEALLKSSGGSLADVKWGSLYLRDSADAEAVRAVVDTRLPKGIPYVTVRAPVCRPSWLVEMECVAVSSCGDPSYPPLI